MSENVGNTRAERLAPKVEEDDLPDYYISSDIPHVLARVRFMQSLLHDLEERKQLSQEIQTSLYRLYTARLNEALAPYALELAQSLTALEDRIGTVPGRRPKE